MRMTILLVAASALLAVQALAPKRYEPVSTAPPTDARYEVIQTSLGMRQTYLLSRFHGTTYVLTKKKDKALAWQYIQREPHLGNKIPKGGYGKPAYQIFMSGVDASETYLVNTETGATWALRQNGGSLAWGVVEGDSASKAVKREIILEEIRNRTGE